jgi:tetratricopeptide (TPR) repeat protein
VRALTLSTAARRATLASVLMAVLCVACATTQKPWVSDGAFGPQPYEAISEGLLEEVLEGLHEFERGHFARAASVFEAACHEAPNDLRLAILYQEARLARSEERARQLGLALDQSSSPRAQLRRIYRRAAEENPMPAAFVLAARLEPDRKAAELLLGRALELDPRMAWAHYALAHVAASDGDWGAVHSELELTFELDPRHLPALRLLAWARATAGELKSAAEAYEAWLERAGEDWLVTERMQSTLELDLALVYLAAGEARRAEELLKGLPGADVDSRRLSASVIAALCARGQPDLARAAAEAAGQADPTALMPAVQEALLLELWLKDPWAAREAWRRVLEISAGQSDLASGLQRFRAQLHLERLLAEDTVPPR